MKFKAGQKVRILPGNGWHDDNSIGIIVNPQNGNDFSTQVEGSKNGRKRVLWIGLNYLRPLKTYRIIL